jgi:hypothetical protein
LHALWKEAVENGALPLFVPVDCNTLQEAVDRMHKNDQLTTIVVGKGKHQIDGKYLAIPSAMNIVGDPGVAKEKIVVVGGVKFNGGIQGNCHLQHLTLRQAKQHGVWGKSSFMMEDILVEQCGVHGVWAAGTGVVGRCTDVEVRQCGWSGVYASMGASITLIGAKTMVHHNCTKRNNGYYGLTVFGSSSTTIQLVSPLAKETVSIDNGGSGNWGAVNGADIHQIKTMSQAEMEAEMKTEMEAAAAALAARRRGEVRVPEDCTTLKEAVDRVHGDNRLTTIVLVGKGEHQIIGNCLEISSAMNIVGDPGVAKEKIVVVGGIYFKEGIQGNGHLQHLTLRQAKWNGVFGHSSFTMKDVLVEQCDGHGVVASGPGVVNRCTNVEVRQCGRSGVLAHNGASITLIGAKTAVHHNCTNGYSEEYGLTVYGSSSTIQLVSPLTKEQVALDNGGGGNWGAENGGRVRKIKTIDACSSIVGGGDGAPSSKGCCICF